MHSECLVLQLTKSSDPKTKNKAQSLNLLLKASFRIILRFIQSSSKLWHLHSDDLFFLFWYVWEFEKIFECSQKVWFCSWQNHRIQKQKTMPWVWICYWKRVLNLFYALFNHPVNSDICILTIFFVSFDTYENLSRYSNTLRMFGFAVDKIIGSKDKKQCPELKFVTESVF